MSTITYSALAAGCLALTILAFVVLGGAGSYMLVLFGGLLTFVFAAFAYESHYPTDPIEPST